MKQVGVLAGEVAVLGTDESEVPFAPGVDYESIKAVDPDPMFVTVSIKAGNGDQGSGPLYDSSLLQDISKQINSKRPPGYKGHQDPNKVAWEYREPVTAWVGARFDPSEGGKLLVKGYVPVTAPELRKQLELAETGADVVNSVSIFGIRETEADRVTSFDLWSLDWTPKGRAGMETELVGVSGEQSKEDDVTREEVIASLQLKDLPTSLVESVRKDTLSGVADDVRIAGEMRVIFELDSAADAEAVITAVRSLVNEHGQTMLDARIDEALEGSEVTAEMAQQAVRSALTGKLSSTATTEEISGEISTLLEQEQYIKQLNDDEGRVPVVQGGTASGSAGDKRQHSQWV